jgi:hypothetical protein
MSDFQLTTPVVFIIFNRPDTTERVFAEIARAQPPRLLVIGDGPRPDRSGEAKKVAATRAIIDRVDWPCEVSVNFSDINLGCKNRVSSGIDWVFEQVEEAIFLEDDCLPDPSFFQFCQEMLSRYRNDLRIGMISGDNFQFGRKYGEDSYFFSKYVHIWGWASWRDRWQGSYDVNMCYWPTVRDSQHLRDLLLDDAEIRVWRDVFERVYRGDVDTWDYQWTFANWLEGRLGIVPMVNLVSNIGFGPEATHTFVANRLANMPVETMRFPVAHPNIRARNMTADLNEYKELHQIGWRHMAGKFLGNLIKPRGNK